MCHGASSGTTRTTRPSRSRKTTSTAKRMKNVWIEAAGRSQIPSPGSRLSRPSSPRNRRSGASATVHRSQTLPPFARKSTTCRLRIPIIAVGIGAFARTGRHSNQ
jgi:hypothetical protein